MMSSRGGESPCREDQCHRVMFGHVRTVRTRVPARVRLSVAIGWWPTREGVGHEPRPAGGPDGPHRVVDGCRGALARAHCRDGRGERPGRRDRRRCAALQRARPRRALQRGADPRRQQVDPGAASARRRSGAAGLSRHPGVHAPGGALAGAGSRRHRARLSVGRPGRARGARRRRAGAAASR